MRSILSQVFLFAAILVVLVVTTVMSSHARPPVRQDDTSLFTNYTPPRINPKSEKAFLHILVENRDMIARAKRDPRFHDTVSEATAKQSYDEIAKQFDPLTLKAHGLPVTLD